MASALLIFEWIDLVRSFTASAHLIRAPPVKVWPCPPAASIWFEVWGVVNPVAEIFDSIRKKFPIFQAKKFWRPFLVVNSRNCLFSLNISHFIFYTYILIAYVSLFLITKTKKTLSNVLSVHNIGYSVFWDPFTTPTTRPATPHDPSPKSGGSRPPTPRIDAYGASSWSGERMNVGGRWDKAFGCADDQVML